MDTVFGLDSFLRSFYAIHSVPFQIEAQEAKWMEHIFVSDLSNEVDLFASHEPIMVSVDLGPISTSPFYCMSRNLWIFFAKTNALHPLLVAAVLSNMGVYHKLEQLYLELLPGISRQRNVRRQNFSRTVKKMACMYRMNWNKRCPLGVSNPIYQKEDFKIARLGKAVENLLGAMCPLPAEMDALRAMSPETVFRQLKVVPAYSVPAEKVARFIVKVLGHLSDDFRGLYAMKREIEKYIIDLGRFENLNFSRKNFNFFHRIVPPLISFCFYVTETSAGDVVYFRRPVWDVLVSKSSLALVDLLNLEKISSSTEGSTVRWIPKQAGGLRPVVSQPKLTKEKSKKLLRYLTCLVSANPAALGNSILTRSGCKEKLGEKKFKNFFFVADFQNCFESISFAALERALHALASGNTQFSSAMISTGKLGAPMRKRPIVFLRSNLPNLLAQLGPSPLVVSLGPITPERMNFQTVAENVMRLVRGSVYRLNVAGTTTSTTGFQVSTKGLPQGSAFSCLLVSLVYGSLDVYREDHVMVRLIDDVLCFANTAETRDEVLAGLERYGTLNRDKIQIGSAGESIVWAGFRFRPDQQGRLNISAVTSPAAAEADSLLNFFNASLGRSIAQNCLSLLFDEKLNSTECRNENAFQAGRHAAGRVLGLKMQKCEGTRKFVTKLVFFVKRRFPNSPQLVRMFKMGFECGLRNKHNR